MGNTVSEDAVENATAAPPAKTSVSFVLNGKAVVVEDASPNLSLNEWIRCQPGLTGTKRMCGEGGCGCCVVAATFMDPLTQKETTLAINSCLCPLYSIEGWTIATVEGIGSSSKGFHPIQQRIVDYNASQCGYCTPGFVMSMYSLLQKNPKPTKQEIEDNFDGNICRCTGYRPILDAMKSFATDSGDAPTQDIEDLGSKVCPKTGEACSGRTAGTLCRGYKRVESDPQWYCPTSLSELTALIASNSSSNIKLVAGDTGRGVFKAPEQVDIFIDLRTIEDLYMTKVTSDALIVGAAVSLSNLIGLLQANKDKSSSFEHLANHLSKIANVPVRNVGTWAGNLMLTHNHDNFPSDVFTMLAGAGATITIGSLSGQSSTSSMELWHFLMLNMNEEIILSVSIPFTSSDVVFRSYKIMPRAVNAHAYVNATFSMKLKSNKTTVEGKPALVFGGIGTHAIEASETAMFLDGKSLLDKNTLKGAVENLKKELVPNSPPGSASVEYRQTLAINLFYKFYLAAIPDHISPPMKSAATPYVRPLSQGTQSYTPDSSEFPVTQPMTKLTAKYQASGEAQYTTDIPLLPDELAAAFVLTTQANANIVKIDSSAAEQMPGFVKILTASDIPEGGKNAFNPVNEAIVEEEVLAEKFSIYAGQAVAIVVADTQETANRIAQAVTVQYESVGPPMIDIHEAIRAGSFLTVPDNNDITVGDVKTAISSSEHTITGQIELGSQYHFHMETQTALCIPLEDSYTVYSATQWTSYVQAAVSITLGIPASSVDVYVKRCGGGFGAKITRSSWVAAACALASHATQRPVRMHMDLDTNMKMLGKRYPYLATYQIGSTKQGVVNGIDVKMYTDAGWEPNDHAIPIAITHIDNAYHSPNWSISVKACKTHKASNTPCRSPGTMPAIFIMESMMDHLARSLKLDVEAVKKANLYQQGQVTPSGMNLKYCNISKLWDQLYQSADVANRKQQVADYNKANRWRKRGMNMMPIKFGLQWTGASPFTVLVSIYATDGTVAVAHGGVEIGQGINTKVAQVAAKILGISIDLVKVKSSNTLTNPNGQATGGSCTSELNCLGTIEACKMLNARIQPIREKNPDLSWVSLIQKCLDESVDLSAKYCVAENTGSLYAYNIYGVGVTEVEVDVLTGQTQVLRVDILYDCGTSINPEIDTGQIEGGFVMGLGYWLTEKLIYDKASGGLLTHNTWEYKPPSSKDIPIDFRVELLKNAPNPLGVCGSKACGEPPTCLSCSALFAVKRAIESARGDGGNTDFFPLNGPATVEDIQQACLVDPMGFTI